MYLVIIAWMYVALMMAVAEATHSQGSILGAIVTFVIYGLLPMAIVVYIMRTPARKAARRKAEALELIDDQHPQTRTAQTTEAAEAPNSTNKASGQ